MYILVLNQFMDKTIITVSTRVEAGIGQVWSCFTEPVHIMQWNQASPDWHCPASTNDLRPGGKFSSTMAAKDGSFSFDFWGIYDEVDTHKKIAYTLGDGRKADVLFQDNGNSTAITVHFEPESQNSLELQQAGWQAILDSYKKYTEGS